LAHAVALTGSEACEALKGLAVPHCVSNRWSIYL
jgi:hypothetical protein